MENLTKQQAYDRMRDHMRAQGKRSVCKTDKIGGYHNVCAYRDDEGNKCPVGALIPDELYSVRFEGCSVDLIGKNSSVDPGNFDLFVEVLTKSGLPPELYPLLIDFQSVHDTDPALGPNPLSYEAWIAKRLPEVAHKHGLTP